MFSTGPASDTTSLSQSIPITIVAVNDPPVAADDSASGTEDTLRVATLLANDSDLDGDTLTVANVGNAINGSVVLNGSTVEFMPTANFSGQASFDYMISDGHGETATATVNLDIMPVADTPTLQIGDLTPQAAGGEFQVNTYTTGNQVYPSVAALPTATSSSPGPASARTARD